VRGGRLRADERYESLAVSKQVETTALHARGWVIHSPDETFWYKTGWKQNRNCLGQEEGLIIGANLQAMHGAKKVASKSATVVGVERSLRDLQRSSELVWWTFRTRPSCSREHDRPCNASVDRLHAVLKLLCRPSSDRLRLFLDRFGIMFRSIWNLFGTLLRKTNGGAR